MEDQRLNTPEDHVRSPLKGRGDEIKKLEKMISDINYDHYIKETKWRNNKIILVGIIIFLIIVLSASLGSNYDRIGEVESLKHQIQHAEDIKAFCDSSRVRVERHISNIPL